MSAPKTIHQLVKHIKQNREELWSDRFNETTDRQIDQLVYALYGLTEEEIRIVEGVS